MHLCKNRLALLGATALIGLAFIANPVRADMKDDPAPPAATKKTDDKKAGAKTDDKKGAPTATKKNDKKSGLEFQQGYKVGYDLIMGGQYQAGIDAMRALGQDDHPDVATSVGYAWRKLGEYDLSKVWYDRALAADPVHVTTLSYYGMWHAEQGNVLKAQDFLQKISAICGGDQCEPYKNLKGVIDGKFTY
jgi:tetratricopeptide (TPR) repeat protein